MQVNFMIIGAQKCGTTNLATQLAGHPEVCFSRVKEPGYFNQTVDWQSKIDTYHNLFSPRENQLCAEASTMYTFRPEWEGTHERLFSYNPKLKLIYLMRDPVERVVSHYSHNLVRGLVDAPPEQVVLKDPAYINRSTYWMQIEPYLNLFTSDQICLIVFEEYISDQQSTLDQIGSFLGLSSNGFERTLNTSAHQTVGNWYLKYEWMREFTNTQVFQLLRKTLPKKFRQSLRRRFSKKLDQKPVFSVDLKRSIRSAVEADVRELEGFLGRELSQWRSGYL